MAAAAATSVAGAATATGGARPPLVMLGPIALALIVLRYLVPLLAAAVVVDAARRPATDFERPFWRWVWIAPQALLLAVVAFIVIRGPVAEAIAGWVLLLGVVCIAMQVGYALEVVFPKRADDSGRVESPDDGEG